MAEGIGSKYVAPETAIIGSVHHRRHQEPEIGLARRPRRGFDETDHGGVRDEAVPALGQLKVEAGGAVRPQERPFPDLPTQECRQAVEDMAGDDGDLSHALEAPECRKIGAK
ncbi:hypothetical protein ASE66_23985 [Bosea sp. Root483D1]|nr:hypothetical protein ASE66_23985 [Bosea sp. Root483D1]